MKNTLWIGIALAAAALAQESVIVKAVDPQWDFPAGEAVVNAPMWVNMTVLEDGTPWEVVAEAPLPIPLMQALQNYQMRPNRTAYRIGFLVETKRLLRDYTAENGAWPAELGAALVEAGKLNPKKAAETEKALKEDAASVDQRSVLLVWAARQNNNADARDIRLRQLEWLIGHYPESDVLRTAAAWIDHTADAEGYARIRQAWTNHFGAKPARPLAIGAASAFFRFGNPELAEQLLKAGLPMSYRAAPALGELYVYSITGVRGLSPAGLPVLPPNPEPGAFAAPARAALESATDPRLLMAARAALLGLGRNPSAKIDAYESLCQVIAGRLKPVLPNVPSDCTRPRPAAGDPTEGAAAGFTAPAGRGGGGRGGRGGGAAPFDDAPPPGFGGFGGPQPTKEVKPVYPPVAKEKKFRGRVSFSAVIDNDGKPQQLLYLRGPLPLATAAYEAAVQWRYQARPSGAPAVEIPTTINLEFK